MQRIKDRDKELRSSLPLAPRPPSPPLQGVLAQPSQRSPLNRTPAQAKGANSSSIKPFPPNHWSSSSAPPHPPSPPAARLTPRTSFSLLQILEQLSCPSESSFLPANPSLPKPVFTLSSETLSVTTLQEPRTEPAQLA